MLGKLFFYLNQNLGRVFFGNPNSLYYNIFNKYHENLISKKDGFDMEFKKYVDDGFFRTNVVIVAVFMLIGKFVRYLIWAMITYWGFSFL